MKDLGSGVGLQAPSELFKSACLAELQAIKPGNVHVFADGHGMVVADFIKSAHAAAGVIALPGLSVGERILQAVTATWDAVGCNTNLGIILLSAPLIHAAIQQQKLGDVLCALTVEDAVFAYQAIRLASPAGLGGSAQHDVHEAPQVTLLQAMQVSAKRDRIAWQYAHEFEDVLGFGMQRYAEALARWENESWATTSVYLGVMARFPDSHVVRKYGTEVASKLQAQAKHHEADFFGMENPKKYLGELLRFDEELKQNGINPGTSADVTVATLLAYALGAGD